MAADFRQILHHLGILLDEVEDLAKHNRTKLFRLGLTETETESALLAATLKLKEVAI